MIEDMMVGEAVSQSVLGVWLGMVITWLRSRGFFGESGSEILKSLTLAASYIGAFVSSLGVHWTFNGDTLLISGLDPHHLLEALVLFASNVAGQKGWALANKGVGLLNHFHKLSNSPEFAALMARLAESTTKAAGAGTGTGAAAAAARDRARRLEAATRRKAEAEAELAELADDDAGGAGGASGTGYPGLL